ncbi:MAG: glucose-1-phosphate cytidylyltransferase [Rhodocyclaceae bacterium]|nr:glucose-1-phosphate cytidylyltransferase [Rhodocyclaceae bacterium]
MKAVILAGGLGTRLSEETVLRPKPMVEIGGKPILWHIMKGYAHFGITDFVICLGYKGYMVKEYFANLALHTSDVSIDLARNKVALHQSSPEPWNITLIDTGEHTQTGGRLRRIRRFVDDDIFCMTYGDGVADIDIAALTKFHHAEKCLATVTAVRPAARFGRLDLAGHRARGFQEKPRGDGDWINGGFFVLSPTTLDHIAGDDVLWEKEPMQRLAADGQLAAFRHDGFWQPMDTLREKNHLEELWASGNAPWKLWP